MNGQWHAVGPLLERVMDTLGLGSQARQWRCLEHWKTAAGEKMAGRVKAVRVQDGVLWLHSQSAAWTAEVAARKHELLEKMNALAGEDVLKDIRFIGAWRRQR